MREGMAYQRSLQSQQTLNKSLSLFQSGRSDMMAICRSAWPQSKLRPIAVDEVAHAGKNAKRQPSQAPR
jgi:hypothetical protein